MEFSINNVVQKFKKYVFLTYPDDFPLIDSAEIYYLQRIELTTAMSEMGLATKDIFEMYEGNTDVITYTPSDNVLSTML